VIISFLTSITWLVHLELLSRGRCANTWRQVDDFGVRLEIVNYLDGIDVVVFLSGGLGKQKTSAHESFRFLLPAWPFGPEHTVAHHHSSIALVQRSIMPMLLCDDRQLCAEVQKEVKSIMG
jgi:hypothetical protein